MKKKIKNSEECLTKEWIRKRVKNPGLSVLLSFFIMGLGQIYNGFINKGMLLLIFQLISFTLFYNFFLSPENIKIMQEAGNSLLPDIAGGLYLILFLGVWFYNIKDARQGALDSFTAVNPDFIPPGLDAPLFSDQRLLIPFHGDNYFTADSLADKSYTDDFPADSGMTVKGMNNIPGQGPMHGIEVKYAYKKLAAAGVIIFASALLSGVFYGVRIMNKIEQTRLAKIEKQLLKNPDKIENFRSLAELYYQKGNPGYAAKLLKRAITLRPDDLGSRILLADFYKRSGLTAEAEKELAKAGYVAQADNFAEAGSSLKTLNPDQIYPDQIDSGRIYPGKIDTVQISNNRIEPSQINESPVIKELTEELLKTLKIDPENHDAYYRLAKIYESSGRLQQASYAYEKCVKIKPEQPKYRQAWVNILEGEKNYALAAENIEFLLRKNPGNTMLMRQQALNLYKAGKFKKSADLLKEILKKSPKDIDTLLFLGDSYKKLNNPLLEKDLYEKALVSNPQNRELLIRLLNIYEKDNNKDNNKEAAHLILVKLDRLFPETPEFIEKLAEYHYTKGNFKEAAQYYEKLRDRVKNSRQLYLRLSDIYRKTGQPVNEIEANLALLDIDKANTAVILRTSSLYILKANFRAAENMLKQVLASDPQNIQALDMLRICYEQLGLADYELETLEKLVKLKPRDPQIRLRLYQVHQHMDDDIKIEAFYRQMLKLDPMDIQALRNLADFYSEKKMYSQAVDILGRISEIADSEEKREAHKKIINLCLDLKRIDQARRICEKSLLLWPGDYDFMLRAARIYEKENNKKDLLAVLLKMADFDPARPETWKKIGVLAKEEKLRDLQIKSLENLCRLVPDEPQVHSNLAALYYDMKQFDKALLIYENLFNEKKASSEEIDNLIRIYKHKDDTENSLRVMKGALKMSPEKNSLRYDYALLLTHDGQYEPAFEQARYLWQSRPNDNGFINLLLRLAGYLNDFDTMILVYESMLAWAPFEEKPHIFRSLANLYAEKGRPERAFNYWMRLSEQLTDDPEAVRAIYEYYDKTENIQGAAEYLEKLLLLEPDKKLENTLKLLTLYTSLFAYSSYSDSKPQKDDKIEELLQSSLKIWPHETRLLVKGISFFMQKADYKQALDLLKALPAREQQARALEFALCYEKAGNLEESFNLYRKAVDTEFTVIAVLGASRTGRRLKALNTVENILNKALEKFDDKELLLEYARFLNDSGKPDRAGEYLESKKAIMPGYAPYWAVLGEVLVKLNNTKNALTAYEKAIDLSPDEPDYLLSGAKIAAGLSNYSQAVDLLKRFLAHNPDHEEAETLLATAYLRSGKPDLAKKHFKNIAGRHPENFLARENLGNLYFNEQDYAKAIAFYLRALEISPKRSAAVFKLASAYKNNSNTEKAIKYFRLLLKMEDAAPEIKRHAVQIVKELEESIKNGEKK